MAFLNMRAELKRSATSHQQCADLLGIDLNSFGLKLDEQAPMTVVEARRIRDAFCQDCTLDYLLESDSPAIPTI